jgi:hypothetical protein
MARDAQKRTVRTAVELEAGQRPRLEQQRRFFSSHGNDKAVREARALEKLFGQAADTYGDWIDEQNYQGARTAEQEAAEGGARREEEKNAAYHRVWDGLEDQRALQTATNDLPAHLESLNAEAMTEKERQDAVNEWMQGQFGGIDKADESRGYRRNRGALAAGLESLEAETLNAYRNNDLAELKEQKRYDTAQAFDEALEQNGELTEKDYQDLITRTDAFLDGPEKHAALAEIVLDTAVRNLDESIIDSFPDKFKNGDQTFKTSSKFAGEVQKARKAIFDGQAARRKKQHEDWRMTMRDDIARQHTAHKLRADAGDMSLLDELPLFAAEGPDGRPPIYTEAQLTGLYDRLFSREKDNTLTTHMAEVFGSGNALRDLTPTEFDEHYQAWKQVAQEAYKQQNPEATPEEVSGALRQAAMNLSIVNNRLPSELVASFRVNANNPEKFKQAAEMFNYIEAQKPGWLSGEGGLPDGIVADMHAYNRILADVGDEDKAIEQFSDYDASRVQAVKLTDMNAAVEDAAKEVADGPLWFNHAQTPHLHDRIRDDIKFYVARGYDLETATQYATTSVKERSVWAGDYIYRADAGWGAEPEKVLEFHRDKIAKEAGVDPDSIVIRPHRSAHNNVIIENRDRPLPDGDMVVPIGSLVADFETSEGIRYDAEVAAMEVAGSQEKLDAAEERAFNRMFPNLSNPYMEPGERSQRTSSARKAWAEMTDAQRLELTMKEIHKE